MENRPYALIAGLFAILLSIGIAISFWWLGNAHTPEASYKMISRSRVLGLNEQAAVRFRGVTVGHVEKIELDEKDPLAIDIEISVDRRLHFTRGVHGNLAGQGLTGLSYIELDDDGHDNRPLGDAPIPLAESDMTAMIESGKQAMAQITEITNNTNRLLKKINLVLDEDGLRHVRIMLKNMEDVSARLEPLLKSSTETLEAARPVLSKFDRTLNDISRTSANFNDTLDEMRKIGVNVNEETLPRINQLSHQLNEDAVSLNRLLNTLDDHPESMIFGKPRPPEDKP